MPRLEAVVEYPISYPDTSISNLWTLSPFMIRLWKGTSDGELGLVMTKVITSNGIAIGGNASSIFKKIIDSDCSILPGGIRATDDKGKIINPSCCCGLESWREWLDFTENEYSPWMGHSPSPEIDRVQNGYYVWSASEEEDKDSRYHIYFSEEEFVQNVQQVCLDLKDFLLRLREWADNLSPENTEVLVNKIDACLAITKPH